MGLFISTVSPTADYKESPLDKAITEVALALALEQSKGNIPGQPSLELKFLIPGKYEKPSFSGMQMAFDENDHQTLYFERAVPIELVDSSKAKQKLRWEPAIKFDDLVEQMVKSDLAYFSSRSENVSS